MGSETLDFVAGYAFGDAGKLSRVSVQDLCSHRVSSACVLYSLLIKLKEYELIILSSQDCIKI